MKSVCSNLTIAIALSAVVGCSVQPANYVDNSTPEKRSIVATGSAATAAAWSNSSNNTNIKMASNTPAIVAITNYQELPGVCCSYYPNGNRNYQREHEHYIENQYGRLQRGRRQGYVGYAAERFKRQADYKIRRKIDRKVDDWVNDIF
jgi:hypothetical protein